MMECTKCTVPCTTLLVSNMVSTTQFATRASKRKQQKFSAILHASLEFSRKFPLKHSQSIEHFISICQWNVHYSSNNLLMNFTNKYRIPRHHNLMMQEMRLLMKEIHFVDISIST